LHKAKYNHNNTLFIHWTFHPNGLQRKDIRDALNATLKNHLDYSKATVAIARPHNLKDILSKTALTKSPVFSAQNTIDITPALAFASPLDIRYGITQLNGHLICLTKQLRIKVSQHLTKSIGASIIKTALYHGADIDLLDTLTGYNP